MKKKTPKIYSWVMATISMMLLFTACSSENIVEEETVNPGGKSAGITFTFDTAPYSEQAYANTRAADMPKESNIVTLGNGLCARISVRKTSDAATGETRAASNSDKAAPAGLYQIAIIPKGVKLYQYEAPNILVNWDGEKVTDISYTGANTVLEDNVRWPRLEAGKYYYACFDQSFMAMGRIVSGGPVIMGNIGEGSSTYNYMTGLVGYGEFEVKNPHETVNVPVHLFHSNSRIAVNVKVATRTGNDNIKRAELYSRPDAIIPYRIMLNHILADEATQNLRANSLDDVAGFVKRMITCDGQNYKELVTKAIAGDKSVSFPKENHFIFEPFLPNDSKYKDNIDVINQNIANSGLEIKPNAQSLLTVGGSFDYSPVANSDGTWLYTVDHDDLLSWTNFLPQWTNINMLQLVISDEATIYGREIKRAFLDYSTANSLKIPLNIDLPMEVNASYTIDVELLPDFVYLLGDRTRVYGSQMTEEQKDKAIGIVIDPVGKWAIALKSAGDFSLLDDGPTIRARRNFKPTNSKGEVIPLTGDWKSPVWSAALGSNLDFAEGAHAVNNYYESQGQTDYNKTLSEKLTQLFGFSDRLSNEAFTRMGGDPLFGTGEETVFNTGCTVATPSGIFADAWVIICKKDQSGVMQFTNSAFTKDKEKNIDEIGNKTAPLRLFINYAKK